MSPAEYQALHVLHVLSVIGMIGAIFFACAGAPETRKRALMWSGIASLVAAAAGMRMAFTIYHRMPGWVWVKVLCWIGLAGLVGLAYKRRAQTRLWVWLTLLLTTIALVMVYVQPFGAGAAR